MYTRTRAEFVNKKGFSRDVDLEIERRDQGVIAFKFNEHKVLSVEISKEDRPKVVQFVKAHLGDYNVAVDADIDELSLSGTYWNKKGRKDVKVRFCLGRFQHFGIKYAGKQLSFNLGSMFNEDFGKDFIDMLERINDPCDDE